MSKVEPNASNQTYRDEEVRHPPFVLLPRLAVFLPAPLDIPSGAMNDHEREEDRIEPREWAVETSDETPAQRKVQVGSVLHLAGVLVPTVAEEVIP